MRHQTLTRRLGRFIATVTLLTLVTAASGCEIQDERVIIRNDTDQVLHLYWVVGPGGGHPEGTEIESSELYPGGTETDPGGDCSDRDWVVRTEDGTEFARRTEPICPDDPWILTDP